jgi:enoyl reductase
LGLQDVAMTLTKAERGRGVQVGDEVLGFCTLAAHAELIVVDAMAVVPRPPTLPWDVAGALSASGQTALNALRDLGVGPGDTLLVHAAAGGVGTVAGQLASQWGATVIGTASPPNHPWLESLGVIPVAYGPGLADRVRTLAPGGVDVALDCIGGDAVLVSLELVSDRNRIGTIADYAAVERFGVRRPGGERSAGKLSGLVELHTAGKLHLPIHLAAPLARAAEAHAAVETGHVRGKVVITGP